jgi:amino acid adenylation domain-containing protein
MFVWHGEYEWGGEEGKVSDVLPQPAYAMCQLSLQLTERQSGCHISLVYDDAWFRRQTVDELLKRFEGVAAQVLANPDMRIADIDILLPGERDILHAFSGNDNVAGYPPMTLQDIFRQTVQRYPAQTAVIESDGYETSYLELLVQVEKVSGFLISHGIKKGDIVAVHMQHSSALIASVLGILDSGCAFLMLEHSLPEDRLRNMLEQAGVAAIVSAKEMARLSGFEDLTVDFSDLMQTDFAGPDHRSTPSDTHALAYIMFTSGSTGIPKGAMIEQRSLVSYLESIRRSYAFGEHHRTLLRTLVSFDACLIELLLPLCSGGAVVLAEPGTEVDMPIIAELIADRKVSHLFCVPSILRFLLEESNVSKIKGILKTIVSGGESFQEALMRDCRDILDVEVFQDYGPTEATVAVTYWKYKQEHGHPYPPIGKPNEGVRVLVMDTRGRQVPPGMPGELWVGGAQTSRGYMNNREETQRRFVEDPVEPGSGRVYYRTGDLVRFLPDGNLLFMGRIDDQLKVRGVRVELGDVKAALLQCEGVREAEVMAEPDGDGSNRLRAWVTLQEASGIDEVFIRSAMSEWLPAYMTPFRIHVLDAIPLTHHDKTDKKALRALAEQAGDDRVGLPITTSTEGRLAELWSELLGMEVHHRDADFFKFGGHSLLMMKMMARLRKWVQEHHQSGKMAVLNIQSFYGNPSLEHLAELIDQAMRGAPSDLVSGFRPISLWTPAASKGTVFVTLGADAQLEGFSKYRTMAESLSWEWDVYALPDPQAVAQQIPDIPIHALAHLYAEAVLETHPGGPLILLGECLGGTDAFSTATALHGRLTDPLHIVLVDTVCPLRPEPKSMNDGTPGMVTSFSPAIHREVLSEGSDHEGDRKALLEAIATARQQLRRGHAFSKWKGDLHLLTNQFLFQEQPTCGWDGLVEGKIITGRLAGDHDTYLFDHLLENMIRFDEVLTDVIMRVR